MVVHGVEGLQITENPNENKHIKIYYRQSTSVDISEIVGLRCNKQADGALTKPDVNLPIIR